MSKGLEGLDPGVMDTQMQELIRSTDDSLFPERQRFIERKENGELRDATYVANAIYEFIQDNDENGARYTVA